MFTDAEKVKIRRHMGYPAYGAGPGGFQSWRYFQAYGTLEFRLQNLHAEEEAVVREYLPKLDQLETDLYGVRDNLDTAAAAVWTRNSTEQGDREALYRSWRMRLCGFLGLPPGPHLKSGGNQVELIV